MNILVIHNKYKQRGGEDAVVENETALLREMGFSVYDYVKTNDELEKFSFVRKVLLPMTTIFSWKSYKEVRHIIKEANIDIIHVHNTLPVISPAVYYAAFKSGIPAFQTIHNFRLLCPNALLLKSGRVCKECIEKGLMCAIKHKCYRNSMMQTLVVAAMLKFHRLIGTYNKINYICLSEYNRDMLLSLNSKRGCRINAENVFVKPNFVRELPEIYNKTSECTYYLFVGRLCHEKGIINLVKMWMRYSNGFDTSKLVICGDGPEADKVSEICSKFENVDYIGRVNSDRVRGYMRNAKAIIVPSIWYEACPLTIVEAFSEKCPAIGSNIGNVNEMIEEGVTGTKFDPKDTESMVAAILRFEKMNTDDLKNNVYKYYKENYSVDRNKELFRYIYSRGKIL